MGKHQPLETQLKRIPRSTTEKILKTQLKKTPRSKDLRKKRKRAMKALKNTEKYEIDGQVLKCSLGKPPENQKSQQPALFPTYPQPSLGYGAYGAGYGAYGAGYGGAGFGQPMMHEPFPIIYVPASIPGMTLERILLPDGRIAYVLQDPRPQGPAPQDRRAQGPAPPLPQQSSSTGETSTSSSGFSSSG